MSANPSGLNIVPISVTIIGILLDPPLIPGIPCGPWIPWAPLIPGIPCGPGVNDILLICSCKFPDMLEVIESGV